MSEVVFHFTTPHCYTKIQKRNLTLKKIFKKFYAIRELPLPDGICGDLSSVKIADIIPFKRKIEHLASFERLRVALVGAVRFFFRKTANSFSHFAAFALCS